MFSNFLNFFYSTPKMDNTGGKTIANENDYYGNSVNVTVVNSVNGNFTGTVNADKVLLGDGTQTSPALGFKSEPDLGIFKLANGELAVVSGNQIILRFNPSHVTQVTGDFTGNLISGSTVSTASFFSFNTDNSSGLKLKQISPTVVSFIINNIEVGYFDSAGIHGAITGTVIQPAYYFSNSFGPNPTGFEGIDFNNNIKVVCNGLQAQLITSSQTILPNGTTINPGLTFLNVGVGTGISANSADNSIHISSGSVDTLACKSDGSILVNNGINLTAGDIQGPSNFYSRLFGNANAVVFGVNNSGTKNLGMWFPGTNKLNLTCNGINNIALIDTAGVYITRTTPLANYNLYQAPMWCYAEQGSTTVTVNGNGGSTTTNVSWVRKNNWVTLCWKGFTITTTSTGSLSASVGTFIAPTTQFYFHNPCFSLSGSTVSINTSGNLIWTTISGNSFNAGTITIQACSISYDTSL